MVRRNHRRNRSPRRPGRLLMLVLCLLTSRLAASGAEIDFRGQISFWLAGHDRPSAEGAAGIRYLPAFSLKKDLGHGSSIDAEVSINTYASLRGPTIAAASGSADFKPYRLWARFTTARFEARLGLQKINFGPALLLRPLMWFDRIDPNDPLQLTDGVYGLLLKYTFPGDANVWLWGLLGNDETKGWEAVPTKRDEPEFGGRVQVPLGPGEAAVSYHHRRMDSARSPLTLPEGEAAIVPEDRIAVDGKWDLGVGLWFEAVWTRQGWTEAPWKNQKTLTLGADYTFGLGNGLHVMAEHLEADFGGDLLGQGSRRSLTAFSADYPISLLDRLRAVVFRDWTSGDWYRIVTWQRTYDRWSFYVLGFWNPETYAIPSAGGTSNLFAGRGFQIMIVYNH
ncbi:MAG: hypothetical protein PHI34_10670 [Acidobacteriota bacterium]|nr:hypothetical protein [Acidobacteriota bacterium]